MKQEVARYLLKQAIDNQESIRTKKLRELLLNMGVRLEPSIECSIQPQGKLNADILLATYRDRL